MQTLSKQALIGVILSQATRSLEFREGLLKDPHRALREELGVTLPPSFRIRFIEREESLDALIVLPDLRPAIPVAA